jgi:LmbE family N-acetylglucosaminyl deacetylase
MKTLIVVAHPDDEVLGMGGTIKKLSKQGHDMKIIYLSTGILARRELDGKSSNKIFNKKFLSNIKKNISKLQLDAKKSSKILGIDEIEFMDFPDNEMDIISNLQITKTIENVISDFKPTTVYTTPQYDVNVDHTSLFYATLTATRPRKNYHVKKVFSFEVLSSSEWYFPVSFTPNTFVDISKELAFKIKAIKAYKNELREFPHPRSVIAIEANARKWGSVSGFNFAEAFSLVRSLDG